MTTSNKSDSLQRPEGRGFSPILLIKMEMEEQIFNDLEDRYHEIEQLHYLTKVGLKEAIHKAVLMERAKWEGSMEISFSVEPLFAKGVL
jgi:hypothetical protein